MHLPVDLQDRPWPMREAMELNARFRVIGEEMCCKMVLVDGFLDGAALVSQMVSFPTDECVSYVFVRAFVAPFFKCYF